MQTRIGYSKSQIDGIACRKAGVSAQYMTIPRPVGDFAKMDEQI